VSEGLQSPQADPIETKLRLFGRALATARDNTVLLALLGAGTYGIGFLIVNSFLASLGVIELELIRPRYLVVGMLFLVLVATPIVVVELVMLNLRTLVGRAAGVLITLAGIVGVHVVMADGLAGILAYEPGSVFLISLVGNAVLIFIWLLVRASVALVSQAMWILVGPLFLFALVGYSQGVYRTIPRWLGGGLPEPVSIVLSPEAKTACGPCADLKLLVDEDEHRLVLLADPRGRARVIAREHVIAVIYEERRIVGP
jgi:hypothetical protein